MKRVLSVIVMINLILILFLIPHAGSEDNGAVMARMPAWRPGNIWQYNMTMPSKLGPTGEPGHQTATIYVTSWGRYITENGIEYPTFETFYITNVNETNEESGFIYNRTQDAIKVIRSNYTWAFSDRVTHIGKGMAVENLTKIRKITKYIPWQDHYKFPIVVGNNWDQSIIANTTTVIYKYNEEGEEYEIDEFVTINTITTYYRCTEIESVTVTLADNEHYYLPNQTVDWSREAFNAFIIKQDNEISDSDGNYIVEYYNETVGNIVKKEEFKNGELYSTRSLVYYKYIHSNWTEPEIPPDNPSSPYANFFLWAGLGIVVILLGVGVIRIRRRVIEEEGLTKDDVMELESRSEFVEMCKKMGLSTKGPKSQLKKRLLKYIEEEESEE